MVRLNRFFSLVLPMFLFLGSTIVQAELANDSFSSSTPLAGLTGTINATNVDATAETDEPNHGSGDTTAFSSVWFSWTASTTGLIFFNTFGSDFDTTIAAYTGTAFDNLVQLATNDDFASYEVSQINFVTTPGTKYHIAVDGYDSTAQGNVILRWLPAPENDDFNNATFLLGNKGSVTGSNNAATVETGEPRHREVTVPGGPIASVWYSWTATSSGQMVFDTFGSNFDTTLAAYTGTAVNSLTQVAANDESPPTNQSKIIFTLNPGTTYYIAVDSFEETADPHNIVLNYKKNVSFLPAIYHLLLGTQ